MLILSRKPSEAIVVGNDVIVKVLRVNRNKVQLGIQAPPKVRVNRQEIYERVVNQNVAAAKESADRLMSMNSLQSLFSDSDPKRNNDESNGDGTRFKPEESGEEATR
jgi:carbon storage regulator